MQSRLFKTSLIILLVVLLVAPGDGRRKILKGRKAITRTYYRQSAIPSWAIVILAGLGELVFGGLLYLALKILVLDQPIKARYVQAASAPGTP